MKDIFLIGAFTDGPGFRMKSQAEIPSTGSATPKVISLRANVSTAWDALCLIYICSFFRPWETDVLIRTIAQKAYSNNYQGKWKIVQLILEEQIDNPQDFMEVFLKFHSKDDFFGNLVYRSQKLEKLLNYKDITKDLRRGKVKKYTGWCRGPVDKGSRRLPHEFPVDPPVNDDKEDYRSKVYHPLLRLESEILVGWGSGQDPHPERRDNYDTRRIRTNSI